MTGRNDLLRTKDKNKSDEERGLRFTRAASQRTNTAEVPVTHGHARSLDAVIETPNKDERYKTRNK